MDPLLRMVDEHADFKIDPTFPSPFYVGDSVKLARIRCWREA